MKALKIICDVAVTAGCCIGVGFISGKEAQVFFGNNFNVAIFCVAFFVINYALREYCRQRQCATVSAIANSMFGRFSSVFDTIVAVCCFVCIVTVIAGVEQCLSELFYVGKSPLYAVAAAVISAIILHKGMSALKVANLISIVLAIVLIAVLACINTTHYTADLSVPIYKPVIYALFSMTMSLGVIPQLATESTRTQNLVSTAISSVIIAMLMAIVLPICDFNASLPTISSINSPILLGLAVIALLLSSVTGMVANAYPIIQHLYSVLPDKTVCCALIFGLALAFSAFGFDFAVKVGYTAVAIVGVALFAVATFSLLPTKATKKSKSLATSVKNF